ncbi:sulfotransferase [Kiritimatiellota bacterium B12222]|nr:sulfotransferase [Kiritimatiellota bacterium B12222]
MNKNMDLRTKAFKVEPSLRRGVTLTRLKVLLQKPRVVLKNIKYIRYSPPSKEQHIFVLGPPRSGTTLMQRILIGNSKVCGLNFESRFFFIRNYVNYSKSEVPLKQYKLYLKKVSTVCELFDEIAFFHKDQTKTKFFLEKTPEHALRLKYLCKKYPNSKYIFMVRDCRDGLSSVRRNPNAKAHNVMSYAKLWNGSVEKYLNLPGGFENKVLLVRYEDLCREKEKVLDKVLSFLNLEYQPEMINTSKISMSEVSKQEGHTRLKDEISDKTVGGWKKDLSEKDYDTLMRICGENMKKLGYK